METTIDNPAQNHAHKPVSNQSGTPFPYPGNKARLAEWVCQNMIHHERFIVPFGGAGGVLFNKLPSRNEILNDLNGDICTFYRVLRDQRGALEEYLQLVPYHEQQYNDWKTQWDRGWRPSDDVKHAAVFYFLQRASFGADQTGLRAVASGRKNSSRQFYNSLTRLSDFSERLAGVLIHNRDYTDLIEKYGDDADTLLYLDPPYTSCSDRYDAPQFKSGRFATWMAALEGEHQADWILSSLHVPLPVRDYPTIETDLIHQINNESSAVSRTEKLTMNYHPDEVPMFSDKNSDQTSLSEFQ